MTVADDGTTKGLQSSLAAAFVGTTNKPPARPVRDGGRYDRATGTTAPATLDNRLNITDCGHRDAMTGSARATGTTPAVSRAGAFAPASTSPDAIWRTVPSDRSGPFPSPAAENRR